MPVQREIIISTSEWDDITKSLNAAAHTLRFAGPDAAFSEWLALMEQLQGRGLDQFLTAEEVYPDPVTGQGRKLCLVALPDYVGRIRVDEMGRQEQEQVLFHVFDEPHLDAPQGEGQAPQVILAGLARM